MSKNNVINLSISKKREHIRTKTSGMTLNRTLNFNDSDVVTLQITTNDEKDMFDI